MIRGALDVKNLLSCVYEASEHVVEDSSGWKQAFLDDGYGARQTQLSASRRKHLQLVASPEVGDHKPSVEQVKLCFPQVRLPSLLTQAAKASPEGLQP